MEKNPYLSIMIQSLKKKSAVLDAVIELNIRQKEELENPGLDPDDFDACVEEKAKQICRPISRNTAKRLRKCRNTSAG